LFILDLYPRNPNGKYKVEWVKIGNKKMFTISLIDSLIAPVTLNFDEVLYIQGDDYNPFNQSDGAELVIPEPDKLRRDLHGSVYREVFFKPNRMH
jgi:hypothetical protein